METLFYYNILRDHHKETAPYIRQWLSPNRYTFEVAPVFTLMENEVIQAFCKLFGFENGDGIFSPGGSISNM